MNSEFVNPNQAKDILEYEALSLNKAIIKYFKKLGYRYYNYAIESINYDVDYKIDIYNIDDLKIYLDLFKKFKINNNCSIFLNFLEILDFNEIYNVIKEYSDQPFINQLRIDVDEQYEHLNFYDYSRFIDKYNEIISSIPESDSELDIILNAYNEVKKYVYKETPDETKSIRAKTLGSVVLSRDDNGPIVCVGYVKLFNMILRSFGIKCTNYDYIFGINNKKLGHQISMVNIDDNKYNVHGIYFFDPCGDSKLNNEDNYLSKYNHFLMSSSEVFDISILEDTSKGYFKKNSLYIDNDIYNYGTNKHILPDYAEEFCKNIQKIDRDLFNGGYGILKTKNMTSEFCKSLILVYDLKNYFSIKEIDISIFLQLLFNNISYLDKDSTHLKNYFIQSILSKYGENTKKVLPKIEAKVKSFR